MGFQEPPLRKADGSSSQCASGATGIWRLGVCTSRFPNGSRFVCDLRTGYDRSVYLGAEEVVEQRLLSYLLRPGDVFVDCGANIGLHTILAASLVGSGGHVFAFEPVAPTFTAEAKRCDQRPWRPCQPCRGRPLLSTGSHGCPHGDRPQRHADHVPIFGRRRCRKAASVCEHGDHRCLS